MPATVTIRRLWLLFSAMFAGDCIYIMVGAKYGWITAEQIERYIFGDFMLASFIVIAWLFAKLVWR